MANEEHLKILLQGVDAWNQWRRKNIDPDPDLVMRFNHLDQLEEMAERLGKGAQLTGADLSGQNLNGVNLRRADLRSVRFIGTKLTQANFAKANLAGADLSDADLSGADLSDANLGKNGLLSFSERIFRRFPDLKTGGAQSDWVSYIMKIFGQSPDNITKSSEAGFNFVETRTGSGQTNLSGANLKGANLVHANLTEANLKEADLTDVTVGWTTFINIDLSQVKGLDKIKHQGPSTLDIHTIYRSRGNIPRLFLEGAGLPDAMIEFVQSLAKSEKALGFYSCFISYSTKDQAFAERLHTDLQAKGVRCWFAPEEMKGGRKIHEQIDQAIRHYDKLLLVLSEHSMNSEWVKTEIYTARQREQQENRRMLFPIALVDFATIRQWKAFDADSGKDMGREVREYFIPDFTSWQDYDSYQQALGRLLRDLSAKAERVMA